jgi:virulence factor Mce-like protein
MALRRSRRAPRRGSPVLRAGIVTLLACLAVTVYAFNDGVPFLGDGLDRIDVHLADASNVRPNQPVRMKGVDVGKVLDVRSEDGGRSARVTIGVEPDERERLRSDARAVARWRTLLGRNLYIDLEPGRSGRPLTADAIPLSRTDHQVELDQVLQATPELARRRTQRAVRGLATGLERREDVRETIASGSRAVDVGATALQALRGEAPGDLTRAIRGTADLVAVLARNDRQLGSLIDGAQMTLAATAARRADLGLTLRAAPASLAQARTGLRRIDATLDRIDPLVADLRPVAPRVAPTVDRLRAALQDTTPTLRRARPLVAALRPALTSLASASASARPLLDALAPLLGRVNERTLPFLFRTDAEDTQRRLFELVGPLVTLLNSAAATYDAQGHFIIFQGGISTKIAEGILPCKLVLSDPDARELVTCENLNQLLKLVLGGTATAAQQRAAGERFAQLLDRRKAGR